MAEKKEKKPKAAVEPDTGPSVSTAKAPVAPAQPARPAKVKKPKLAKKNKSRLPRRQKKALQKAARAQQG